MTASWSDMALAAESDLIGKRQRIELPSPEENARAREFMDLREQSLAARPTLEEMRAWADRQDSYQTASIIRSHEINGVLDPVDIRRSAVSFKLVDFLEKCIEHKSDIATLFRAKAHQQRRRG